MQIMWVDFWKKANNCGSCKHQPKIIWANEQHCTIMIIYLTGLNQLLSKGWKWLLSILSCLKKRRNYFLTIILHSLHFSRWKSFLFIKFNLFPLPSNLFGYKLRSCLLLHLISSFEPLNKPMDDMNQKKNFKHSISWITSNEKSS